MTSRCSAARAGFATIHGLRSAWVHAHTNALGKTSLPPRAALGAAPNRNCRALRGFTLFAEGIVECQFMNPSNGAIPIRKGLFILIILIENYCSTFEFY